MINIALVGLGHWGPNIARSLENTDQANVSWLCDLHPKRLEQLGQKYPKAKLTDSVKDILADDQVHAVAISTPVATHFELALQVLESGKHLLIEKPITMNAKESAELYRVAEKNNKILMVGHVFLYNSSIQALKSLVQKGELGNINYIYCERTNLGPVRTDVNALWDLTTHDLSIMLELFGEVPTSVNAQGGDYLNKGIDDVVFAHYRFNNGAICHMHSSWINPRKVRQITVVGDKKMAVWDDLDMKMPIKIFDKHVEASELNAPGKVDSFIDYKTSCVDGGLFIPNISLNQPLQAECQHFIDCVQNNKKPLSDGYNAYQVMCLLEATQKSVGDQGSLQSIPVETRDSLIRD